jgi:hypothetical protein
MRTDKEIRKWFEHYKALEWTWDDNSVEHFIGWLHTNER